MKEFYITDDLVKLHCKLDRPADKEKCPLFIMVHGLTGHMEEEHIIAVTDTMVSCGFAVLRAEMYGHGQSEGKFYEHTLLKWLGNVMAVTDYAKKLDFVTDLYLSGHSQGGLTTMLAAGMRPKDYKAIIPMAPAICITDGARKGEFLGISFDPCDVPDEIMFGEQALSGNYIRAAQSLDLEQMIRNYTGPVLLVHGDADEAVDVQYSIDAAKKYSNAELVIIPGDTHCYDYHLDQVTKAVEKFLKNL